MTDTELELPQGWVETELDSISQVTAGNAAPQGEKFFENGKFNFVRVNDMGQLGNNVFLTQTNDKVNKLAIKNLKLFPKGSVLFTKSGASLLLNQRAILKQDSYVVSHIGISIPVADIPSEWIYYFLRIIDFADYSHATNLPSIKLTDISQFKIPLPPLNEQKRIVSKIEKLFSKIDHIEKLLENSKVNLIKLRYSILNSVLFEEWIKSDISNELTKVPLSALLKEPLRGGRSSPATKSNSGIPILKLSAVTYNDFSNSNIKLCDVGDHKIDNLWVKKKDILIERSNSPELVGISAIYEGDDDCFIFPDLMIRIRVDEHKILPNFLAIYLSSPKVRKYFQKNARSSQSSMPKISQPTINDLEILLPKITKQKEILKYLESISSKYDPLMKEITNDISILKTMRFSILQFAFEGKLVPQDPNDESSEKLLERIKIKQS